MGSIQMTEKDIVQAYVRIRKIDNTIPDEVLDFMKDSAIRNIRLMDIDKSYEEMADFLTSSESKFRWKKSFGYSYVSHRFGSRDIQDAYQLEMKHKADES